MNEELLLQSQILSNLSECINLVKAENGEIVFSNSKFDEMFGYKSGELIGKNISVLNAPIKNKSPENTVQEIMNYLFINNDWKGEVCNIKKDGTIFWSFASVSWFNHPNYGKVLISFQRDISEQKMAEKELMLSKERLKGFMHSATDGFILFDSDLNHIDINNKALEIIGLSRSEVIGKNLIDIVPDLIESGRYDEYKKIINTGKKYIKIFKPHPKFGDKLVEIKAFKVHSGLGMILNDITKPKQIEKELQENEEKLRNIFENSTNLFYSHTAEHILTYLSPQVNNILGCSQEEAMINWTNFASNNPINEIGYNNTVKAIETGKQQPPYELELIHKSGRKVMVEVREAPVVKNGKTVSIVGALTDITERKKAELDLNKSNKKLRELSLYMQESLENERMKIALNLHDDLGQKLTALNMDISWLKRRTANNLPELSDKLNEITNLLHSTMQDVQKIATGLRPPVLDDLGLISAIEWLLKEYKSKSRIKYQFNISPRGLKIKKRLSVAIFRIIQEALTNVIRHANATLVIVSIIKKDKLLNIVIDDNGKGITKRNIENSKSFGLMGIKERANVFKGKVKISGEPNKGTKLKVKIPYE